MNKKINRELFFLALLLLPLFSIAQESTLPIDTIFRVKLKDGTLLKGKFIKRQSNTMVLQSPSFGNVTILRDSIKRIRALWINNNNKAGNFKSSRVWGDSLILPHYFISSSAIPLQKGELDVQDAELFYFKINYAFSNFISAGFGVDLLTPSLNNGIYSPEGPFCMADVKVGHRITGWLYLGAQGFISTVPADLVTNPNILYYPSPELLTMAFGTATFGNVNNNVSASVGYDYISKYPAPGPTYTLSGILRISKQFSLITENWLFPVVAEPNQNYIFEGPLNGTFYQIYNSEYGYYYDIYVPAKQYYFIGSCGIRLTGKRISFDIGIATNQYLIQNIFPGYPFASCTFRLL